MAIQAQFEQASHPDLEFKVNSMIDYANQFGDNDDCRLDHMKEVMSRAPNLWVYRGGNHVAVHYKHANGTPTQDRLILITGNRY